MIEDYTQAKKLGEAALKAAAKNGESPFLPVLEEEEGIKNALGEAYVGLMELPLDFIVGNKEASRNNAFANNFMPLLDEKTEFAQKWANLYDSYRDEGIREAIKCYEYMNRYYVQEGNKRVSVSLYGKSDFILADVTRILPAKDDSKEVKVYYEYLDFYAVTKCYYIVFSEPGEYARLAEILGQDLENPWPEELLEELKSAFYQFSKLCASVLKVSNHKETAEIFLQYLTIFPLDTLSEGGEEEIIKKMKSSRSELFSNPDIEEISYAEPNPGEIGPNGFQKMMTMLSGHGHYEAPKIQIGFVYNAGIDESRWVESHEMGRLYLEQMPDIKVSTGIYLKKNYENGIEGAIRAAVEDKNDIIFTTTPSMLTDTLKAALEHPEVKFLNCSVGQPHPSIRCYHGKLFEPCFLVGVLAADVMLTSEEEHKVKKIGYIVHETQSMSIANLNAFAIGVSMIDPECRIDVKYMTKDSTEDYRREWQEEGIYIYADFQYSTTPGTTGKPGLYKMVGEKDVYLGAPYFNWGKAYSIIVKSVLSGTWDEKDVTDESMIKNYWFGISSGVVDVVAPNLPYQTKKMLSFMKTAMVNGDLDPFSGELHSGTETVHKDVEGLGNTIPSELKKMPAGKIVTMDWFNENIDGTIPLYTTPSLG